MDDKELEPVNNADEQPQEPPVAAVDAGPQAESETAPASEVAEVEAAIEVVETVEVLEAIEVAEVAEAAVARETASTDEPAQESLVVEMGDDELRAIVEAVVYVTEEPLTVEQIAIALQQKKSESKPLLPV